MPHACIGACDKKSMRLFRVGNAFSVILQRPVEVYTDRNKGHLDSKLFISNISKNSDPLRVSSDKHGVCILRPLSDCWQVRHNVVDETTSYTDSGAVISDKSFLQDCSSSSWIIHSPKCKESGMIHCLKTY